ncbi:MAG: hypothetical protein NW215_11055 [Hyphomicrobiales bacterium]|nr:hypothetical protein [Hyphomicrobiales bacterium]
MAETFGMDFDLLTRDQIDASVTGNPFVEKNWLILRLRGQQASARPKYAIVPSICPQGLDDAV